MNDVARLARAASAPEAAAAPPPAPPLRDTRAAGRRWRRLLAACGIVAAVALLALSLRPVETPARRVVPADLRDVSGLSWDGERLWATVEGAGVAYRLHPGTGAVEGELALPVRESGGSAWVDGDLLQLAWSERTVYRLDPASGRVTGRFPSPGEGMCSGMTWDGRHLWLANWSDGNIYRVDPARQGEVVAAYPGGFEVTGLAWDGRYLWNGLLVGPSSDHDAPPPETGFVQQRDVEARRTLAALPLPGVFAGTTDWVPGGPPARRMWWFDGHHQQLVEISWRPPAWLLALRGAALALVVAQAAAVVAGQRSVRRGAR